jgi:NADH-quinone oxidoreductase subunit C
MSTPEEQKIPAAPAVEPSALLKKVIARLGGLVLEHQNFRGDDRIHIARERIVEAASLLRDSPELNFDLLLDVTCVDYFGQPDEFRNAPEIWDRTRQVLRRRPEWRHRVNMPERGDHPRFAVVYHLVSTRLAHRLRVKCRVPEDDPTIASLAGLWASANWLERETFDLYGIRFSGHPDLRRIYLYDGFVGHPLRKDYAKHDEQPIEPYAGPGAQEPRRPN